MIEELTEEQKAFVKDYILAVNMVSEEDLINYFNHGDDLRYHIESKDHITDCWWLWGYAYGYGRKQNETENKNSRNS